MMALLKQKQKQKQASEGLPPPERAIKQGTSMHNHREEPPQEHSIHPVTHSCLPYYAPTDHSDLGISCGTEKLLTSSSK